MRSAKAGAPRRPPAYLSDELAALVDEGYRILTRAAPGSVGVCTDCCMEPAEARLLLTTPVREIPEHLIHAWHGAAYAGDLRLAHLLWLLPRHLDMLAQGKEIAMVGDQVVFQRSKVTVAARDWPAAPHDLFHRFAGAHMAAVFADPERFDIEAYLCLYGLAGMEMAAIFDRLAALPPAIFSRAVTETWGGGLLMGWDAFWEGAPALHDCRAWFSDPHRIEALTAWAIETNDPDGFAAVQVLERIAAAAHAR